jgi:hypothetical protein
MWQTYVDVLLNAQRRVLNEDRLLVTLGGELFESEKTTSRHLMRDRLSWKVVRPLACAIAQFEEHGFRQRESAVKRVLKRVLGYRAEWLSLT